MALQTTSQRNYTLALQLVGSVSSEHEDVRKIYEGLCRDFPVMVRQAGLAQAAAYHEAKAQGANEHRKRAHRLLLDHMAALIGQESLIGYAESASTMDYLRATQRLLSGAVFFKRLAVSMLGATADLLEEA